MTGGSIGVMIDTLPYDCIYQDQEDDYFLKYFQSKMNKEHVIPISKALSEVIIEQQSAVKKEWGVHLLLFPTPNYIKPVKQGIFKKRMSNRGQQLARRTLAKYLQAFAVAHNIRGSDGKIWPFSFHPFRHTIATQMINNKVPQHIVQRFLGHESPTMTSRYAHIHDETLKKAFTEFYGKITNIAGEVLSKEQLFKDISSGINPKEMDAIWLKKNIQAQTLPNGICALPAISNHCPHANACLTCVNFRTDIRYLDIHREQLKKTNIMIKKAQQKECFRQAEMNQIIQANLEKIIATLEETSDVT